MIRFIPIVVFVGLAILLAAGLTLNPREVPSPFIGKQIPLFQAKHLSYPVRMFSHKEMLGQVWLLNFWATWCPPCREEHPILVQLARSGQVPIVGVNYKDDSARAVNWLKELGDPYKANLVDTDGTIGIEFGVYGMPETFVIDRDGIIRHKRVGALTRDMVDKEILPLVKKLQLPEK